MDQHGGHGHDGVGKHIPDPGFAGDAGSADERTRAALEAYRPGEPGSHQAVLAALQHARLLVPVVAILGEVEYHQDGLAQEKTSDMATVMITGADGRRGLLAFTSMQSLSAWRADGRPVPVTMRHAAAAALSEGAAALILDLAGPVPYVVEHDDLVNLAAGHVFGRLADGRWAWVENPGGTGPGVA